MVSVIDPIKGVKRVSARKKLEIINSGYSHHGASYTKKAFKRWFFGGGSAKEDIIDNLQTLRERTRDLYYGTPIATGVLKTYRTNVVGSGLRLKSQIDYKILGINEDEARAIEEKIEREFSLWADSKNCDNSGLDNFYELQQLVFLNWLLSGDVFVALPSYKSPFSPYDLKINLIESDRVMTPYDKILDNNIVGGVETNSSGQIIAYYINKRHPLSSTYTGEEIGFDRVEPYGKLTGRRNLLHIMNRERIGQVRGTPFLSPVIEALKQLGNYTEAELMAAVISGMFTVFIEKENSSIGNAFEIGDSEDESGGTKLKENEVRLGNGAILDLEPGEKANIANPGRPNTAFDGFVTAICQQIGVALEIPLEILLKQFNSSYSASKAALMEFWKAVRMYRTWLVNDFCQPIFEEFMCEAVAKGRVNAPGFFADPLIKKAYLGADWSGPAQGMLNPVQEVAAAEKRVLNGFSTRAKESIEMNGTDFYKNAAQLAREEKQLAEIFSNDKQEKINS